MTAGPILFARYAYPPNALGYCGPADSGALLEYAAGPVSDAGLAALARIDPDEARLRRELIDRATGEGS